MQDLRLYRPRLDYQQLYKGIKKSHMERIIPDTGRRSQSSSELTPPIISRR